MQNDERNAADLVDLLRLGRLAEAYIAPPALRELRELVSLIDKAVKRGALHRNTGARKKSRAARVRAGIGS